jgi:acyl-CoA carboxylase epsilon subunit
VDEPLLKVVKGDPTPAELAAVVSAVAAKLAAGRSASGHDSRPKQATGWAAYWRNVRRPLQPGPGAWRRSALPG